MPQLILADKSDLFRRSISSVLQREGYEVMMAETGQRVLSLVQQLKPTAIILDTETPDPSGLETLLLLKRDPALRRLPVILVSRDSAPTAVSNAFKVGAEGFMLKPIDVNQLLKTLSSLQVPLPQLNEPVQITFGAAKLTGKLRFIDQFGTIYLDKELSEIEQEAKKVWDPNAGEGGPAGVAPPGSIGTIAFETEKGPTVYQRVLLAEENDQGIAVYPAGDPAPADPPSILRVPVNYKGRYLIPGSFMKLTEVVQVHGEGVVIAGLAEEPRYNSPIQMTVYPPSGGQDGGITLHGKITSTRTGAASGQYEADVALTEAPGAGFVSLLAEAITGKPFRAGG